MSAKVLRAAALAGLAAAYIALAIVHTWPLVAHRETALPGLGLGDNVSFVWNLWWMRHALASPSETFFGSPPILAPLGAPLVLHTHTALAGLAGATILAPLSVVHAQNVLLMVSLALNGVGAYLLAYAASSRRGPSAIAGALFLVAPAITTRLMGHFNLVLAWPMVFACLALVKWWRTPTWRRGIVLGLSAGLIPYADYYYTVFFGLFAAAYAGSTVIAGSVHAERRRRLAASRVLLLLAGMALLAAAVIVLSPVAALRIGGVTIGLRTPTNALTAAWLLAGAAAFARWKFTVRLHWQGDELRSRARRALLPLAVCAVLAAPLAAPAWALWQSGDYVSERPSLKSGPRGVDLATLALGPPQSGATRPVVATVYRRFAMDPMESSAWIGLATMALVAMAWCVRARDREIRRWLAIGAFFFVWALGPALTVLGGNTGLVLPQAIAHFVPILNNARIPGRAMAMVALSAAVLVSLVLARIQPTHSSSHARARVSVIGPWALALVALVESLAAPLPLVALPDPGIYQRLRAITEPGAVLTLPLGVRDGFGERGRLEHESLYGQTIHGRPLVGGFLARVPPRVWSWYDSNEPYRTLLALSSGAPSEVSPACEAVARGLRSATVSHVVLHPRDAGAGLLAFVETGMPLEFLARDDHRILYRVNAGGCSPTAPAR